MCRSKYVYFKSTNFVRFCYFCVDHNTKNFVIKNCMPTGYIIDYIRICFHIFLKLRNIVFNYFRMEGSLELGSQKHFLKILMRKIFQIKRFEKKATSSAYTCHQCIQELFFVKPKLDSPNPRNYVSIYFIHVNCRVFYQNVFRY
jgi:hypothetical protein